MSAICHLFCSAQTNYSKQDARPLTSTGRLHWPEATMMWQATEDVAAVDNTCASVLHAAAAGGCWEMVDLLLQQGCDINATTREGCTVLHYAAFGGSMLQQNVLA